MENDRSTTLFTGTAQDYLRYRPPYPGRLLERLRVDSKSSGSDTLLDLACGPGRIAIPMANHFRRVIALDIEPEMIDVGRAEARRQGITNIEWRVGAAESVSLPLHSIKLVTIGDAFHRLDQARILEHIRDWLSPSGAIATLGSQALWHGARRWQHAAVHVINRWTNNALGDPNAQAWGGPSEILRQHGYDTIDHDITVTQRWTSDSIVGFLYSTSIASRRALGTNADAIEAELRRELLAVDPCGQYESEMRFGFTLGIRRADAKRQSSVPSVHLEPTRHTQ